MSTAGEELRRRAAEMRRRLPSTRMRWTLALVAAAVLTLPPVPASAAAGTDRPVSGYRGLTAAQRATLRDIARDTWKFYSADVDPQTHLPLDNVTFAGGSATPTSRSEEHTSEL